MKEILDQIEYIESLECDTRVECILMLSEVKKLKKLITDSMDSAQNESRDVQHNEQTQEYCQCLGGANGRSVTEDFEHQICDSCGKWAN